MPKFDTSNTKGFRLSGIYITGLNIIMYSLEQPVIILEMADP